ncbi:MAG TPA: ribose-5-phosphate isomerase A, partial [Rhizomicrobium sp.]
VISLRMKDGAPYKTDGGNVIYDCALGSIGDAAALATALKAIVGVVEHGLFIGLASTLVIAHTAEAIELIERKSHAGV